MDLSRLNWLRAGVLGANDGIISVSVILISVVSALEFDKLLLVALSSSLGGALSMAIGEYVSVSAQRDAELAANHSHLTNPYHATLSSFTSFLAGALIPCVAALATHNLYAIVIAVLVSLGLTTAISSKVGKTKFKLQLIRNLASGVFALLVGLTLNFVFRV